MPPTNYAAWLITSKASKLEVKSAPYTSPASNQVVIKTAAVAINPVDHIKMDMGEVLYSWVNYPLILGYDVAGEVVEVGSGVTRFKPGDRVIGLSYGMEKSRNTSAESGFQHYTVLHTHMTSPIPDYLPYESAAVLPLGLSTAAVGLFQKDQLALQYPSQSPKPTGQTVLIWGGSTSVGCNAIQLAVSAGYEVFTTCSPKNFPHVKTLGASQAFDYRSKTVIQDIIDAFKGKPTAGALTIGNGGAEACLDILATCKGRKFLSMANYPAQDPKPTSFVMPRFILFFIAWSVSTWFKSKMRGIGYKFIWGGTLVDNGLGKFIFEDYLPTALAQGGFRAAPEPEIVGKGLENIEAAFDILRKGVSAKKLVVTL